MGAGFRMCTLDATWTALSVACRDTKPNLLRDGQGGRVQQVGGGHGGLPQEVWAEPMVVARMEAGVRQPPLEVDLWREAKCLGELVRMKKPLPSPQSI